MCRNSSASWEGFLILPSPSRILKAPLLVLSRLYGAGVRLRNSFYSSRLFQVERLREPVISVGNLTMGGTGKTPTVVAIGQLLQREGCLVSVLLRGYKGENN